jgi:hypothetical protein
MAEAYAQIYRATNDYPDIRLVVILYYIHTELSKFLLFPTVSFECGEI